MKKLLALCLCVMLAFSAFSGCSGGENPAETTTPEIPHSLSVGFGRADITTTESVPLAGTLNPMERFSKGVIDPIYSNCIAFTDETGNTFLLIISDVLYPGIATAKARNEIYKKTGIPANQIWTATTHNHSAPALAADDSSIATYSDFMCQQIVKSAEDALADRKPAKMYITDTYPERLNFVRHYLMKDGSYAGDNFGDQTYSNCVSHAAEVDNQMQLIKFTREGAKDIVMMNWQGHPTGHGDNKYQILSCVTVATKKIEKELDCHLAYVLGASGNVNSTTRIKEERITSDYVEIYELLADKAIEAAASFREVSTGKIQIADGKCDCNLKEGSSTMALSLSTFAVGDVAFVAAPYEMFCENGVYVKENSPFKMTFVSTCTNGYASYIPSEPTYAYGGYEVNGTDLAAGSAERLAEHFVSLLNTLHEAN